MKQLKPTEPRAWPLAHVGARVASGLRSGALCCIEKAGGLSYFLYLFGKLLLLFLLCLVQLHLCFVLSSLDGGIVQCLSTSRRSSLSANLARFTELLDFAAGPCRAKDFAPPFCRPEACRARPPGFCIRWANKNMFPPGAAKAEMAKHKVSDRDFVKMRMAALGHDVDVSGVDQAAFMDCDLPRASKPRHGPRNLGRNAKYIREHQHCCGREYRQDVGEGPVAASGHCTLLFSLPNLYTNDPVDIFDGLVLKLRPHLEGPVHLARRIEWTTSVRQFATRHLTSMVPTYQQQ